MSQPRILSGIRCPVCSVRLDFVELSPEANYEGINGKLILCNVCAGMFVVEIDLVSIMPVEEEFFVRVLSAEEKLALQKLPEAPVIRQLQEAIAARLGDG